MRSTTALNCTSETGHRTFVPFVTCHERGASLRRPVAIVTSTRPEPCGCFSGPRLLELARPSGDVCAEVRSSRAYHTRHLPPLGFLIPSTVYSFRRIACPVSYKRHLWGSKNRKVRARSSCPGRLIQRHANRDMRHERADDRGHLRGSIAVRCCSVLPLDQSFVSRQSANASLTVPSRARAQEAGAQACRFAPDRPCEGSSVAAAPCDVPVVRRTLMTATGVVVTVSVTLPAEPLFAAKNDPVTKNLRPPFSARSQELSPRDVPQFPKDQPSHLFATFDHGNPSLLVPSRA